MTSKSSRQQTPLAPDLSPPERPEMIIEDLIGPGVTVIGSSREIHRFVLQEQMAAAIISGERFLECFKTEKCRVLYVVHGEADYQATKTRLSNRVSDNSLIDIRRRWNKIGRGCIKALTQEKKAHSDLKIAFLGDFENLKSPFSVWYKEIQETLNEKEGSVDGFTKHHLLQGMERNNIKKLRDLAAELKISIVIGQPHTTDKKLSKPGSFSSCDTEISLKQEEKKVKGKKIADQFELKIVPNSNYVQSDSWDLHYDDRFKCFRMESIPAALGQGASKYHPSKRALDEYHLKILKEMGNRKVWTPRQIHDKTGIKRSTVYKKLRQLKSEEYRGLIIPMGDKGETHYILNSWAEDLNA